MVDSNKFTLFDRDAFYMMFLEEPKMNRIGDKIFKFPKAKILETLRINAETHKKEFKELLEKNTEHVKTEIQKVAQSVGYPDLTQVNAALRAKPTDHSRDYERMIKILEMTTQEEIELTGSEFERYIEDEWDWKDTFLSNKMTYGMA